MPPSERPSGPDFRGKKYVRSRGETSSRGSEESGGSWSWTNSSSGHDGYWKKPSDRSYHAETYAEKDKRTVGLKEVITPTPPPPPPPPPPQRTVIQEAEEAPVERTSKTRRSRRKSAAEKAAAEEEHAEQPDSEPEGSSLTVKVDGREVSGEEAMEHLMEYVQAQKLDSFAMRHFCKDSSAFAASSLFEEIAGGKGTEKVTFRLPASCQCRFDLEEAVGAQGPDIAKQKLAARALEKLVELKCIGTDLRPLQTSEPESRPTPAPCESVFGHGGVDQRAMMKQPLSEWGKSTDGKVQLYSIDCGDSEQLGLATIADANFCYELG